MDCVHNLSISLESHLDQWNFYGIELNLWVCILNESLVDLIIIISLSMKKPYVLFSSYLNPSTSMLVLLVIPSDALI